jgi:Fe-S cluster assembly protein SufD
MSSEILNPVEWYRAQFTAFEKGLNGDAGGRAGELRRSGIERFASVGFPTTRDEEWRFTNTAALARMHFGFAQRESAGRVTAAMIAPHILPGRTSARIVLVNGHFAAHLSSVADLPRGVTVEPLAMAFRRNDPVTSSHLASLADIQVNPFTALQAAFLFDGVVIHVPEGIELADPLQILLYATKEPEPQVIHPRILVVAEKRSRCSLVEAYAGAPDAHYFTNAVSEIVVGEDATLAHDILQVESPRAYHVGSRYIAQGRGSTLTSNALNLGGGWVRNNVYAKFTGEGAECTLNGLSLATGEQLIDNHTTIDHAVPRCASHELYKAILDGKARGVFNGKIYVRPDAQKTDARQTNKTLLLSDEATIDTKPQLEIFADDVKCTHGATVGQLDEEQLFYLRTRGIDLQTARDLLTFAFAGDVINRIYEFGLRDSLDSLLHARLQQGHITTKPL